MSITIEVEIYSPRWGHNDTYKFVFEKEQLTISHMPREVKIIWREGLDPEWTVGDLKDIFENDSVYPPAVFNDCVEHVWTSWRSSEISDSEAEKELKLLIKWLNTITQNKPESEFWGRYF